jgi:secretion/DNA translocation related TadE-like protein
VTDERADGRTDGRAGDVVTGEPAGQPTQGRPDRVRERGSTWPPEGDRGSATVWVAIACLLTWSGATVALAFGAAITARHRAVSSADLSALAGARTLADGSRDPCAEAERVAAAARARLVACERLPDGSLQVVTEVALPPLLARWSNLPPAQARARAGASPSAGVLQLDRFAVPAGNSLYQSRFPTLDSEGAH